MDWLVIIDVTGSLKYEDILQLSISIYIGRDLKKYMCALFTLLKLLPAFFDFSECVLYKVLFG